MPSTESKNHEPLRVLLIGNGGREHALAWKLSQSQRVHTIYVAPGNGGTAHNLPKVQNVPLQVGDFQGLAAFTRENEINFVVPGPEQPLVDGIVDYLESHVAGIRVFGPRKQAALLEGSKTFSKDFMSKYNIPTARYQNFADYQKAKEYLDTVDHDIVIKATGLAAGKGVILPQSKEEAQKALHDIMVGEDGEKAFGSAGNEVVIEERLLGEEISLLSFCDGHTIGSLPPAQDHKRAHDGDQGLNTGGMGCYGPTDVITPQGLEEIHRTVLQPTIDGMRKEQCPFVGLLFTGFMLTRSGPKVLEYNVRFGDPETQTLLPLMNVDLAEVMVACTGGYLDAVLESENVPIKEGFSATIIAAAGGYPEKYDKGDTITIQESAAKTDEDHIFHAGTSRSSSTLQTAGGRVIATTSTAPFLKNAVANAYETMQAIHFPKMHYRRDIAHHAFTRAAKTASSHQHGSREPLTYALTGVSIDNGEQFVQRIKGMVAETRRPGALAELGGFGGIFDLSAAGYPGPRLVTGTDGVGTKLMISLAMNKHDTVGVDLVAMNVNDIVACGAEPLWLTDVYSCHRLHVDTAVEVVRGICDGCIDANCTLLGGETAEMGVMFKEGEHDITATTTGAIPVGRTILPDKAAMRPGDVLLGLSSSGCHSNGFSLIRKIIERAGLKYEGKAPWGDQTVGEELLTPTRIYVRPLLEAIRKDLIKGMAHITGGGLIENIPRMLPKHLAAELDASKWAVPPVQRWLKAAGNVEDHEFSRVFNTGLGMVLVVAKEAVEETMDVLRKAAEKGNTTSKHVISVESYIQAVGQLKERERDGCVVIHTKGWQS